MVELKGWNVTVEDTRSGNVVYSHTHTNYEHAKNDYENQRKIEIFGFNVFLTPSGS